MLLALPRRAFLRRAPTSRMRECRGPARRPRLRVCPACGAPSPGPTAALHPCALDLLHFRSGGVAVALRAAPLADGPIPAVRAGVWAALVSPAGRSARWRAEGAALCVPDRRDRLRSGAGDRPVLQHRARRTSSRRRWSTSTWRNRCACAPTPPPAMPEISADFRRFMFRIKPGIYFADDPAFKGQRRELTAQDYVYSLKRHYDPRWKSGKLYQLETDADRRPERAAPRSHRSEEAVRLRPRGRRPARARPLHASR